MRGRARRGALSAALALLVVLAACSGTGTNGSTGGYVSGDGTITVVDPDDRKPAPVLAGDGLDGEGVNTADYAGKTIVVNAWGSWCAPCREEAPTFEEVSRQYADADVQFVGVNVRDNPAAASAFNRRFNITYPSIDDYNSRTLLGFADSLPGRAIPTTWIIDSEGRVAVRIMTNHLQASTLAGLIDDVKASVS